MGDGPLHAEEDTKLPATDTDKTEAAQPILPNEPLTDAQLPIAEPPIPDTTTAQEEVTDITTAVKEVEEGQTIDGAGILTPTPTPTAEGAAVDGACDVTEAPDTVAPDAGLVQDAGAAVVDGGEGGSEELADANVDAVSCSGVGEAEVPGPATEDMEAQEPDIVSEKGEEQPDIVSDKADDEENDSSTALGKGAQGDGDEGVASSGVAAIPTQKAAEQQTAGGGVRGDVVTAAPVPSEMEGPSATPLPAEAVEGEGSGAMKEEKLGEAGKEGDAIGEAAARSASSAPPSPSEPQQQGLVADSDEDAMFEQAWAEVEGLVKEEERAEAGKGGGVSEADIGEAARLSSAPPTPSVPQSKVITDGVEDAMFEQAWAEVEGLIKKEERAGASRSPDVKEGVREAPVGRVGGRREVEGKPSVNQDEGARKGKEGSAGGERGNGNKGAPFQSSSVVLLWLLAAAADKDGIIRPRRQEEEEGESPRMDEARGKEAKTNREEEVLELISFRYRDPADSDEEHAAHLRWAAEVSSIDPSLSPYLMHKIQTLRL